MYEIGDFFRISFFRKVRYRQSQATIGMRQCVLKALFVESRNISDQLIQRTWLINCRKCSRRPRRSCRCRRGCCFRRCCCYSDLEINPELFLLWNCSFCDVAEQCWCWCWDCCCYRCYCCCCYCCYCLQLKLKHWNFVLICLMWSQWDSLFLITFTWAITITFESF